MKYEVLKTGSAGNAVVIEDIIMIDCGVSFKVLNNMYKNLKIVLLTHIHSDHFKVSTIRKLAKERPTLRFACGEWLLDELLDSGVSRKNIDILSFGRLYNYRAFKVSPVKLYHDVENMGFRIYMGGKKTFYATDTGHLHGIKAEGYDLYMIEANYTETELKERIRFKEEAGEFVYEYNAAKRHLSREQADEWLLENMCENSRYVYLHQHKDR